jgi:hypothetical protein
MHTVTFVTCRMSRARLSIWLGAGLFVHGLVASAQTVDAGTPDAPVELRRELAGHNFIGSRFGVDPFVETSIASETGFGYGWAQGKTFDINGHPVTTASYQVAAFAQTLSYQYGFLPWWAVRVGASVIAYTGTNSSGAAGVGTSIRSQFSLGTTLSWKVGDNLRLGGAIDVIFGPALFLNIVQSVVDSINNGEIVSPVDSYQQFTFQPSFVGAWAIARPLGLTFSLGYAYAHASSPNIQLKSNVISGEVLFDFDLGKLDSAPIGFIGGFQTLFSVADTAFLQYRYQFGIFYTGVQALNVGVEFLYTRAPIVGASNVFLSSFETLIDLQYNFN